MTIEWIGLDKEELPEHISVEMSRDEAAFIARLTGSIKPDDAKQVMSGGDSLSGEIWRCLAHSLFNRYWEGGVDDV